MPLASGKKPAKLVNCRLPGDQKEKQYGILSIEVRQETTIYLANSAERAAKQRALLPAFTALQAIEHYNRGMKA